MLYLSVTTMTSLGLSDIVPVRPHARAFVMIEQIAGMLYLALAVARIMALTVARNTAARGPSRTGRAQAGAATHGAGSPASRSVMPAVSRAPRTTTRRTAAKVSTCATIPP